MISTWNICTKKLDGCINSEGDFSSEMEGQGSAHLMLWEIDVLEIPGSSGTVLLVHGKQRPRAGGREPGVGGPQS